MWRGLHRQLALVEGTAQIPGSCAVVRLVLHGGKQVNEGGRHRIRWPLNFRDN